MAFINEKLILPIADMYFGNSISEKLRFLNKSQWWSHSEMAAFQVERLKIILEYAFVNIGYYKSIAKKTKLTANDFNSIDDLQKLPIITKEVVREKGYAQFVSENFPKRETLPFFTSGSSGQPYSYFLSKDSYSFKYAAAIRGWQWMGFELGDNYAKLSQNKRKGWKKKLQDRVNRCSYYYVSDLKDETLLLLIQKLDRDRPPYIRSYPDPMYFMAQIMEREGITFNWVKAINTTASTLYDEHRLLIEKQFGCKVYDSYSCEGTSLFYNIEGYDGYLGSSETAITEVLDENDNPVAHGQPGRLVTTELWNFAMPFIRYDTRDLIIPDEPKTIAGRNLMAAKKIIGRETDVLIAPDGNRLIVQLCVIYFCYYRSVLQFQIEQTDEVTFIFRLVVSPDFTREIENEIRSYWSSFLTSMARVIIEIHDNIPLLVSGKRRFLIRNPEIKLY